MFGKKKEVKTQVNTDKLKNFKIAQISSPYKGVKVEKMPFEKSIFVSPSMGTGINDKPYYDDVSNMIGDTDRKYENFRDAKDKKFTKEQLLEKNGTLYPEFEQLSKKKIEQIYGEKIELHKETEKTLEEVKEENPISFDFVEEKENISNNEEAKDNVNIGFNFAEQNSSIFREFSEEEKREVSQNSGDFFLNKNLDSTKVSGKRKLDSESIFDDPKFKTREPEIKEEPIQNNVYKEDTSIKPLEKVEVVKEEPKQENNFFDFKEQSAEDTQVSYEEMPSFDNLDGSNEPSLVIDKYKDYKLPPLSLLSKNDDEEEEKPEWLEEKAQVINDTLQGFNVDGHVTNSVCGPTFTRYEVSLAQGVNVNKILSIENNIQMSLGVKSIRIQAPIPGKTTIGIEVPNPTRRTVLFGDIMTEELLTDKKPLNVPLGKDIDGNVICSNIGKWPHGLIAGGTGSGKSVCINTIVASLILKNKPNELKFIMIDPKYVELCMYDKLPHMIMPVIQDMKIASSALKWAVDEMNRRYVLFATSNKRDIQSYNEKANEDPTIQKLPYIVIIIDELAELMLTVGSEVEDSIQSITQKARAAGIHLIVATQRPDKDSIKGTIKANIGTRLAFRVSGQVNSQIILGETGAEALLGNGDMLLKDSTDNINRVQGSYIPDSELDSILEFIFDEAMPDYQITLAELKENNGEGSTFLTSSGQDEVDPNVLYQVAKVCIETQSCSMNMLTQEFSMGFNKAKGIVNKLEELHIVSEMIGNKRKILINLNQLNDMFERNE